jgi:hypothetical protein
MNEGQPISVSAFFNAPATQLYFFGLQDIGFIYGILQPSG